MCRNVTRALAHYPTLHCWRALSVDVIAFTCSDHSTTGNPAWCHVHCALTPWSKTFATAVLSDVSALFRCKQTMFLAFINDLLRGRLSPWMSHCCAGVSYLLGTHGVSRTLAYFVCGIILRNNLPFVTSTADTVRLVWENLDHQPRKLAPIIGIETVLKLLQNLAVFKIV